LYQKIALASTKFLGKK